MKRILAAAILATVAAPLPAHAAVTWNLTVKVGANTIYPGGAHKSEDACFDAKKVAADSLKRQKAKGIEVYCLPLMDTQ